LRQDRSTPRRGFALRLGWLAALLAAGCGGGGHEDAPATASRAPTEAAQAADIDLLPLVNPFVGTKIGNPNPDNQGTGGAVGNTFPGATLPFGMVQYSPDTGYGEFYGFGGYNYDKGVIQGISLIHSSGTGCSIQQDISMLPIVGNIASSPGTHIETYQVGFSHANEQATMNGNVVPGTKTARFMQLVRSADVFAPLSGTVMEFNGRGRCVAGCPDRQRGNDR